MCIFDFNILRFEKKHSSFMILKLYADEKVYTHNSITVWKNARTSKTKMYKQKSDKLSIITIRWMHKAKIAYMFPICSWKKPLFVKWHPLKQTKSKNRHHYWWPIFWDVKLCCLVPKDSTALKLPKSYFASAEHGSVSLLYIKCAILYHKKWWIIN